MTRQPSAPTSTLLAAAASAASSPTAASSPHAAATPNAAAAPNAATAPNAAGAPNAATAPNAARADTSPARPSGARFIVQELERRGIELVVGIPGGAILPLYDALTESSIRHVLARHEQAAGFIAQGLARATGKAAVCLATSGPGATNLITALADAHADSIPLVAITAQVPRALIGTNAFQEVDTCALARPITKACFFASSADELAHQLPRAFELAEQGRPGPVLVDIPKDVLNERLSALAEEPGSGVWQLKRTSTEPGAALTTTLDIEAPASSRPAPKVARRLDRDDPGTWRELARCLAASQRPLLYIGGGIHMSGASAALLELARRADLPVVSSLHGLGAFPGDDPRFLGMLGMHGAPYTNHATEAADFVLAMGARFDDRATGKPEHFCRNARIAHIDVDPRELGKIKPIDIGIAADARLALQRLLECIQPARRSAWHGHIAELRQRHPEPPAGEAQRLLTRLGAELPPHAIVTTDVGQHQMWAAQALQFREPRTLLTSGGLGTMGFGLPAALGAALAKPDTPVICISGDGSFLMNVQELASWAELGSNVITFVLNNAQLGLVRQQQQLFYGRRYSAAHFERRTDFAAVAAAFGIRAETTRAGDLDSRRLRQILAHGGPALIDVQITTDENVLPMVPPGAANIDMIV